jgi:hypothetical protein
VSFARTTTIRHDDDDKPTNLKVLPKDISEDDLHKVMRLYSRSLGVRCGYCHVANPSNPRDMNFAADDKPEKLIAREMIKMTNDINKNYLASIGKGDFETITCVSCHNGKQKPLVSIDSLPKPPMPPGGMAPQGGMRPDSSMHH